MGQQTSTMTRFPTAALRRGVGMGCFTLFYACWQLGMISYRDFVYSRGIHDFGLADTAGNLFGVGAVAFFVIVVGSPRVRDGLALIGVTTFWLALHEFAQLYLPGRVFDWRDLWATAVGGLLAAGVLGAAWRIPRILPRWNALDTNRRRWGLSRQRIGVVRRLTQV